MDFFRIHFTAKQCKNKFHELFSEYKNIKHHNNQSGNDPIDDWPYYNIFDECCAYDANVLPIAAISSINPKPLNISQAANAKEKEKKIYCEMGDEERASSSSRTKCQMEDVEEDILNDKSNIKIRKTRSTGKQEVFEFLTNQHKEIVKTMKESTQEMVQTVKSSIEFLADRLSEKKQ